MSEYIYLVAPSGELYHHGIKGMKWGVRRYQNPDGSLTEAGKKRQARRDTSDSIYRIKQTEATSRHYDNQISRAKRDVQYWEKKYNKQLAKGASEAKLANTRSRITEEKVSELMAQSLKKLELKKVSELTHEQINKERMAVGKAVAASSIATIGSAALSSVVGAPFFLITTPKAQNIRSNARLANETKSIADMRKNAYKQVANSSKRNNVAMLTSSEAKRLGLDENTRITGKEEEEFWKELARQYEK